MVQFDVIFYFFAEPSMFEGHTSYLRKALWLEDDRRIVSAADDKTIRCVLYVKIIY
jgi:hypothetical protein